MLLEFRRRWPNILGILPQPFSILSDHKKMTSFLTELVILQVGRVDHQKIRVMSILFHQTIVQYHLIVFFSSYCCCRENNSSIVSLSMLSRSDSAYKTISSIIYKAQILYQPNRTIGNHNAQTPPFRDQINILQSKQRMSCTLKHNIKYMQSD